MHIFTYINITYFAVTDSVSSLIRHNLNTIETLYSNVIKISVLKISGGIIGISIINLKNR